MSAQKDIFRGATYAYALNRVAESKISPGDAMLKAYTFADGFANIDLKLSILKNPPAEAQEKWKTANGLFVKGKYERAGKILSRILVNKRYPREVAYKRAQCCWELAEAAFRAGNLKTARSYAREMVRICPVYSNVDKTLSGFFAATGIAELVKEKPDLHAALRDFRIGARLTLNGEALAGLVVTLWQTRKLGAAVRWATASSKLVAKNKYAAALAAFIGKVKARDFPGAEKALLKLRDAASEGNESVFAEIFKHELEWEKYIAEQESKGRSYESIIKDVDKYRSESDAFRKAAGRTSGKLPGK
jgi:tetratricopeptide (TPR) repeat protein